MLTICTLVAYVVLRPSGNNDYVAGPDVLLCIPIFSTHKIDSNDVRTHRLSVYNRLSVSGVECQVLVDCMDFLCEDGIGLSDHIQAEGDLMRAPRRFLRQRGWS